MADVVATNWFTSFGSLAVDNGYSVSMNTTDRFHCAARTAYGRGIMAKSDDELTMVDGMSAIGLVDDSMSYRGKLVGAAFNSLSSSDSVATSESEKSKANK